MKFKDNIQVIKFFFIDTYGWLRSLLIYILRSIKKPSIFYGYCSYYWASKYADKRTKKWKSYWDQAGRKQGVLPIEDKLLTCSKMEIEIFKKKKLVNKKINPRKVIKKSYYTTEL